MRLCVIKILNYHAKNARDYRGDSQRFPLKTSILSRSSLYLSLMIRILFQIIFCFTYLHLTQSHVIINEILARNEKGFVINGDTVYSDWIELHNTGNETIDLGGHYLTDNFKKAKKWRIPDSTLIEPGSFLLFIADGKDSALHTNFGLSKNGEKLALYSPGLRVVDSIMFGAQLQDVSYGRKTGDTHSSVFFTNPTPGIENDEDFYHSILEEPQLSCDPGFYSASLQLTISHPKQKNVDIRFTLDGSEPTQDSKKYQNPITIDSLSVIRTRAFKEGSLPSKIVSATYFLSARNHELPLISLITEPENFFGDSTGIYIKGKNGAPGYCMGNIKRNYCRDWERPVYVEFFEANGKLGFSQQMGVKIHGKCTRNFPQKSLAFFARAGYGKPNLNYRLFSSKNIDHFEAFILRNSGNDFGQSMFRDALMSELTRQNLDVDYQAYQPVSVYLNGKYWGMYNLREKINEHFVASNHDVNPRKISMMEDSEEVVHGNIDDVKALSDILDNKSILPDNKYSRLKVLIDMPSYIDYIIAEMYCVNTDWLRNNIKYWKPQNGKWRWILFDTDLGFGLDGATVGINMFDFLREIKNSSSANITCRLFSKLMESDEFKEDFRKRYLELLSDAFHPEKVIHKIDSISALIANEMVYQEERGGEYRDWYGEIEKMKKFATERPGIMISHLNELFDP